MQTRSQIAPQGLLSERTISKENILFPLLSHLAGGTEAYFLNYSPPVELNRFIQKEVIDIVKSLYRVLSPPAGYLRWKLERHSNIDPKVNEQLTFLEGLDK